MGIVRGCPLTPSPCGYQKRSCHVPRSRCCRRRRKVAAAMAKWCLFYAWKDSLSTPHQLRLLRASLGFIKNAHFWQDTCSVGYSLCTCNVFKSHTPSYMCILLLVRIQALEKSASHNFFSYNLSMLLQQAANFLWWSGSLHLFAAIKANTCFVLFLTEEA